MPEQETSHYCYRCGNRLKQIRVDGFSREVCSNCGYIHYQQYKVGVAAILFEEHKLLLLKRNQEPWEGYWNFPAGFLELEETPEEAVVREVKEESGFDVAVLGFHSMIDYHDDPRGNGIVLFFRCKKMAGEFMVNQEVSDCKFFSLDEIPERIASTSHRQMIAELKRNGINYD
jgi:mutator protein MutT